MWKLREFAVGVATLAFLSAQDARADEGVIEINQARALAGGVTPGDLAGFPVSLSLSGSYRLTGNLTPPGGRAGIAVDVNRVEIDLNGFAIVGTSVCPGTPPGSCTMVHGADGVTSSAEGTRLRNGALTALDFGALLGSGAVVEDVEARGNAQFGVQVGTFGSISRVLASGNRGGGISMLADGLVVESGSFQNSGYGIYVGARSSVLRNRASQNTSAGIFVTSGPGLVEANVALDNAVFYQITADGPPYTTVRMRGNVLSANGFGGTGMSVDGSNLCGSVAC
jgi:hypothetical protein